MFAVVLLLAAFWFNYRYKKAVSWILLSLTFTTILGLVLSRYQTLPFYNMASRHQIEVVNGIFRLGEYTFANETANGVDYRKIYLGDRNIKIYNSSYMYNRRCYRGFYRSSSIPNNSLLRLQIYWFTQTVKHKDRQFKFLSPCILKIESSEPNYGVDGF